MQLVEILQRYILGRLIRADNGVRAFSRRRFRVDALLNASANGLGNNSMFFIILRLTRSATLRLRYRAAHGIRHFIGVENHLPSSVARASTDRLNQRGLASQKALFVRVKYRD